MFERSVMGGGGGSTRQLALAWARTYGQSRAGDFGPLTSSNVDHVDREVGELLGEIGSEVVATRFNEEKLQLCPVAALNGGGGVRIKLHARARGQR